jgi:hypothetical protein
MDEGILFEGKTGNENTNFYETKNVFDQIRLLNLKMCRLLAP